jgi:hypothetical protein
MVRADTEMATPALWLSVVVLFMVMGEAMVHQVPVSHARCSNMP